MLEKPAVVCPSRPTYVSERIQIDLIDITKYSKSNFGYNFILTAVDLFSKYAQAYPIQTKHAAHVAEVLVEIIHFYQPHVLHTDNGKEFTANIITKLCEIHHIEVVRGKPRKPSSQRAVERFNRTLKGKISKHMSEKKTEEFLGNGSLMNIILF